MADSSVDEIRERMAKIRARAHRKASRLGEETRQFFDWKHYVRSYPWPIVGVAAAVGYFVVPRKVRVERIVPDPRELADLVRREQVSIAAPEIKKKSPSFVGRVISLLGPIALRAGMNYATQGLSAYAQRAAEQQQSTRSPYHEPVHPSFR